MPRKWFQSWFNSPYYHILYSGRDHKEAEFLIDNLTGFLRPAPGSRILDIACGKGRHAIFLSKKGFNVTGIDLSENSINYARQFEHEKLHFFVHDMRKLLYINYFDIALNLFTSFGYFETEKDHVSALKAFRKGLKADGTLVLDYFNTHKVIKNMVASETKETCGIRFCIKKAVQQDKIVKTIEFKDQGHNFHFAEKVQAFTLEDFNRILNAAGLKIEHTFGSYQLTPYDQEKSDRLILICKKL